MSLLRCALLGATVLVLAGCGGSTIFKTFNIDSGSSVSLDAKQRVILVTSSGGQHGNRRVVCAEPSPDALVAQSAAIAAEGGFKGASAKLAASFREAARTIGVRTTTVQLLRDGLYRACEAHMNGVIGKGEYQTIINNYDRVMTALFAIDAASSWSRPSSEVVDAGDAATSSNAKKSKVSDSKIVENAAIKSKPRAETPKKAEAVAGGLNEHGRDVILAVIKAVFTKKSDEKRPEEAAQQKK